MSRKNKKSGGGIPGKGARAFPEADIAAREGGITRKGSYLLGLAGGIIVAGYISLSKAAPDGRDAWASLAAILLTAGYLLIPAGIMAREAPVKSGPDGKASTFPAPPVNTR